MEDGENPKDKETANHRQKHSEINLYGREQNREYKHHSQCQTPQHLTSRRRFAFAHGTHQANHHGKQIRRRQRIADEQCADKPCHAFAHEGYNRHERDQGKRLDKTCALRRQNFFHSLPTFMSLGKMAAHYRHEPYRRSYFDAKKIFPAKNTKQSQVFYDEISKAIKKDYHSRRRILPCSKQTQYEGKTDMDKSFSGLRDAHILVTGGAGFIGTHLCRLLREIKCSVTVLDDFSTGSVEHLPTDVHVCRGSVTSDIVDKVMTEENFSAVVHLAGQTMVNASIDNPVHDADINVRGTVNVLDAMRRHGVPRIIFASTAAVYGDNECLPLKEDDKCRPLSFYALSKQTAENYLRLYHDVFSVSYVVLRFANVYGEYQGEGGEGGVISIFVKEIAAHKSITVFGDGKQTRDFIYAGDIARGICAALTTPNVNDTYNLSTNVGNSLLTLIELLGNAADKKIRPRFAETRVGDILHSRLDNAKARAKLCWQPQIDLADGLKRTYKYFAQT